MKLLIRSENKVNCLLQCEIKISIISFSAHNFQNRFKNMAGQKHRYFRQHRVKAIIITRYLFAQQVAATVHNRHTVYCTTFTSQCSVVNAVCGR